jgi:SAM-dependent methyltransferase
MTARGEWLDSLWPLVRAQLPAAPARVLDVGCGPLGGFVPFLQAAGYDAAGVDPEAPQTDGYHRVEFEQLELPEQVDAIVTSTALHHVGDPEHVIDRLADALTSSGMLVVVEWAWERFDLATASWCFERLAPGEENWLQRRHADWASSGEPWEAYFPAWAEEHGLHRGDLLVGLLDERLARRELSFGPYCFPELPGATAVDEQAAIDAGQISAMRIDWVGTR